MDDKSLHRIVTVKISEHISAQGPTVEACDPRRPSYLPTDMHGKLAVRTGENTVAAGYPIRSIRAEG